MTLPNGGDGESSRATEDRSQLLQRDFLGFGLFFGFFFCLEARTEILPGETEIKQQFVFLSHPVFSYFSLAEEQIHPQTLAFHSSSQV